MFNIQTLPVYLLGAFLGFVILRTVILARQRNAARRMRRYLNTTGLDALQRHLEAERNGSKRPIGQPVSRTVAEAREQYSMAFLKKTPR
jgi:hypothetical protein